MPVYKAKNGTWYVMVRFTDWTGAKKQKCQRGFETKREAQEWEAQFKLQKRADIDMTLENSRNFSVANLFRPRRQLPPGYANYRRRKTKSMRNYPRSRDVKDRFRRK